MAQCGKRSHNKAPRMFQIDVGVASRSDVEVVASLLLQAKNEHKNVLKSPVPEV